MDYRPTVEIDPEPIVVSVATTATDDMRWRTTLPIVLGAPDADHKWSLTFGTWGGLDTPTISGQWNAPDYYRTYADARTAAGRLLRLSVDFDYAIVHHADVIA